MAAVARALHRSRSGCPVALSKEGTLHTATVGHPDESRALQLALLPESIEPDVTGRSWPAVPCDSTAGYDPALLVTALEEIAAREAAIEWLLDADLLCLCLV